MTFKSYREAHAALLDADRNRGRVFNRILDKQNGGPAAVDRLGSRAYDRAIERARRHPNVREADEQYRAISEHIKEHWATAEAIANRRLARTMGL